VVTEQLSTGITQVKDGRWAASYARITNPVRHHYKSACDRLQSWGSFAWMHMIMQSKNRDWTLEVNRYRQSL